MEEEGSRVFWGGYYCVGYNETGPIGLVSQQQCQKNPPSPTPSSLSLPFAVAAHPADAIYCTLLAQSAVHGAMAGLTGFSTGLINNRLVYVPITAITANSPRRMNPRGRTYERGYCLAQFQHDISHSLTALLFSPLPAGRSVGNDTPARPFVRPRSA